jgi:hypothetical protein
VEPVSCAHCAVLLERSVVLTRTSLVKGFHRGPKFVLIAERIVVFKLVRFARDGGALVYFQNVRDPAVCPLTL